MPVTISNRIAGRQIAAAGGLGVSSAIMHFGMSLFYAVALCYAYEVLSLWWAYFGFTYNQNNKALLYLACVGAALPATLLVSRPRTFAECSAWFLYILVFLPCMIVPVMQYSSDLNRLVQIFVATFVGCVLFLVISRGEVKRIALPTVPPKVFWGLLAAVWVSLMLFIVISFGESFQFVSIDDIYTQRFAGAEVANTGVRYAMAVLVSAIDPFLIAAGLYTRRYWLAGVGVASQFFLFGTLAARAVLLSPLFVIGAYFLTDRDARMRGSLFLIGLLIMVALTAPLLAFYNPVGGGFNNIVTLVYLRTLLISGAIFGVYEQFFAVYPLTYYSNNNIISSFVQYPFGDLSVGQAVLLTLIPSSAKDIAELNANFLATDGIAALGVVGVPVASAASALILRLLSRFIQPERTMLMTAAGTGFILSMANTSLLTSLVTGGGIALVALVCCAPLSRR